MRRTTAPVDEDWVEANQQALLTVLEELSSTYSSDRNRVPVDFSTRASRVGDDHESVIIDLTMPLRPDVGVTGPNYLRAMTDLLSHEVAHLNWTRLDSTSHTNSMEEFAANYPGWENVAGSVRNILEDEYINYRRMQQMYGMRRKCAYRSWLKMQDDDWTPPVDEVDETEGRVNALVTALHQTAIAGKPKGIENAAPEIAEFCSYAKLLVQRVRTQHAHNERDKLAHAVMQLILRYVDDVAEEYDGRAMEMAAVVLGGEKTSSSTGGPDIEMDGPMEAEVEKTLEELSEEGEFPDQPLPDEPEPQSGGDEQSDEESEPQSVDGEAESEDGGSESAEGESAGVEPDGEPDAGLGDVPFDGVDPEEYRRMTEDRDLDALLNNFAPDELKVVN